MEWLYEAIIRFLQGPMYSTPLMGFIDEACVIFDTEEENKLEYTKVHEDFKKLVDTLISDYLQEIGVPPESFVDIIAKCVHKELNNFVLASILTVDDFCQFKTMMVKRNIDLTNEVLNAHGVNAGGEPPMSPILSGGGGGGGEPQGAMDDEEAQLEEVMRLSREQFELESTRMPAAGFDTGDGGQVASKDEATTVDDQMAKVLQESMQDIQAMELDKERAELEAAIQLSLQLEQEQQRLMAEEATKVATPPPLPVADLAPPVSTPTPAPAPTAFAPPAAMLPSLDTKKLPLPAISATSSSSSMSDPSLSSAFPSRNPALSSAVGKGGAGYSAALAEATPEDRKAIREAAAAAARSQREMLITKKQEVLAKQEAIKQTQSPDLDLKIRQDYVQEQRKHLIAKKKAQREKDLNEYKSTNSEFEAMIQRNKAGQSAKKEEAPADESADAMRAQLRQDLARKLKQELMHKSLSRLDDVRPKA